jgi:hypothetical protein
MRTLYSGRRNQQTPEAEPAPQNTAQESSHWYSLQNVSRQMARKPGQIAALFSFLVVAGILIYVFAAGQETTNFGSAQFTAAPKIGLTVGSDGAVRLSTMSSAVANFDRVVYQYSSTFSIAQEAQKYVYINMQSTDSATAKQLKAANPNLQITVYQDGRVTRSGDPTGLTTCVPYNVATSHPEWFLKDSSGKVISYPGANGSIFPMDFSNAAYRQECATHAIATAKTGGFDGIFFDEIDARYEFTFPSGEVSTVFPNDTTWQNGLTGELTYLEQQLHANGLLSATNLGGTTFTSGLWQTWCALSDICFEESWTDGGEGTAQQIGDWANKLAQAQWSETNHKETALHSYNTTESGNTYGLASMMLIANGYSNYSVSPSYNQEGMTSSSELIFPEYTTAVQLGAPTGAYAKMTNGVYKRTFQNGIVLVNPTASTVPSFALGGSYTGSGQTNVTSVSMAPTTGLIMLKN